MAIVGLTAHNRQGGHKHAALSLVWLAGQVDEAQKALQFVSISSDGNVNVWTMNKSELTHESLMKLRVVSAAAAAAKVSRQGAAPMRKLPWLLSSQCFCTSQGAGLLLHVVSWFCALL